MPVHDWTRVDAGIFHDFHNEWFLSIKHALNGGLLPEGYYALSEQHAAGFKPDVLTLQCTSGENCKADDGPSPSLSDGGGVLLAPPKARVAGETDREFYLRKQKAVTVRHVSGDRLVAMIEVVSSGNKSSHKSLRDFVEKATELIAHDIQLLILDLDPPGNLTPNGIHAAIWADMTSEPYVMPADKPLTLASYETNAATRAYVEHVAVGGKLIDMPLFLRLGAHVEVPLEATYTAAWNAVPRRWREVLQPRTQT